MGYKIVDWIQIFQHTVQFQAFGDFYNEPGTLKRIEFRDQLTSCKILSDEFTNGDFFIC
jgi:hypothetical protein